MTWGWKAWAWLAARALWTLFFGSLAAAFGLAAYRGYADLRSVSFAWANALPALAFGLVFALGASHAVAVCRGRAAMSDGAMGSETSLILSLGAIFGLMFAITWPSFSRIIPKSIEAQSRSRLSLLRQGLSRHLASRPAPATLEGLLSPGELAVMPELRFYRDRPHPRASRSITLPAGAATDSGLWGYSVSGASATVFIDCTHTDSKGVFWNSY